MPFTRENVKFTVLTIGFVLMVITGVVGVTAIAYSPKNDSTPLYAAVTGFVTMSAGQLLVLLRVEQANSAIQATQGEVKKTRHEIKEPMQAVALATEKTEQTTSDIKHGLENGGAFLTKAEAEKALEEMRLIAERIEAACCKGKSSP